MRPSLYTNLHKENRPYRSHRADPESVARRRWRELPTAWRDRAVEPLRFVVHADYEALAFRALGYDEDEKPCFCAYQYATGELLSDDDEEFYEVVTYAESLAAWRLRDGRWLIHRRIVTGLDDTRAQSFYSLSETMPR